jgi:hypothetical protein
LTSVERMAIRNLAYNSDPVPYPDYMSKNMFQRLSNHDLIGFGEKYITLTLACGLFCGQLYAPDSEKETEHRYIGLSPQRSPLVPDMLYEQVWA